MVKKQQKALQPIVYHSSPYPNYHAPNREIRVNLMIQNFNLCKFDETWSPYIGKILVIIPLGGGLLQQFPKICKVEGEALLNPVVVQVMLWIMTYLVKLGYDAYLISSNLNFDKSSPHTPNPHLSSSKNNNSKSLKL